MNHNRLPAFNGNLHLPRKHRLLFIARRVIVKIIQPNLAARQNPILRQQTIQLLQRRLVSQPRLMRMNPRRSKNPGHSLAPRIGPRNLQRPVHRIGTIPNPNRKNPRTPAANARSSIASRSPSYRSLSRCACESIMSSQCCHPEGSA